MKFALVSHVLPPAASGQATVLARLLAGMSETDYCLIGTGRSSAGGAGRRYRVPPTPKVLRGRRLGLQAGRWLANATLALATALSRSRRIAAIAAAEGCRAIVGCTGDPANLPAAYLASRRLGLAFWAYIFDDYVYQQTEPVTRWLAARVEPFMLRGAAGIIAPNEFMAGALLQRYGAEATVIHNPVDLAAYSGATEVDPDSIVYTGAVYEAQSDAVARLSQALIRMDRPGLQMHVYTNQSPEALAALSVQGPLAYHGQQPASAMPAIQQAAGVLFLPLAFDSAYPEVIRTSAPGKLGEYLAAGRPILVHAPAGSYLAWYFREHGCGLVVDRPDRDLLACELARLLDDRELQDNLAARARARAEADFSIAAAARTWTRLLGVAWHD